MESIRFIKRLFQAYYKNQQKSLPSVSNLLEREFAFLTWENNIMIRHIGFKSLDILTDYLIHNVPKHMYSSASLYELPDASKMDNKNYLGCDLIFDIDADHLDTTCKEKHDFWECESCNQYGTGLSPKLCPNPDCKSTKFKKITWICEECLEKAKKEIFKLINEFLEPDFGINKDNCFIFFSGHRGYHLHIEDEKLRKLSSHERREIVDYITGNNISFTVLGLEKPNIGLGFFNQYAAGWPRKIMLKLKEILSIENEEALKNSLSNFSLNKEQIGTIIKERKHIIDNIVSQRKNPWNLLGFGIKSWENLFFNLVKNIGTDVDIPVTIDIHRLIRYPGSLHGSSGFKVVGIEYKNLESFDPFSDPVIFSKKNFLKLEITVPEVPKIRVRENIWGPFKMGEVLDLPHDIGIFLLCKNVATLK